MHPLDRAKQRYGLDLTSADLREIEARIVAGEGILRGREGDKETYYLPVQDRCVCLAFKRGPNVVTSFLPLRFTDERPDGGTRKQVKGKRGVRKWRGKREL